MRWINRRPDRVLALALALAPFAAVALAYVVASDARLAENPADKLLPSPARLAETARAALTVADARSGAILFWADTWASLGRLGAGVAIAAALALGVGIAAGLLPAGGALLAPFVAAVGLAPPLALLPIIFIALGLGETSKIALIVIGTAPAMIREIAQRVREIPTELLVKAQSLGASSAVIALRVALPLAAPRLILAVRLALGPAWLFLIAAEAIASTEGLGYRIFLVRRYLAMDLILVYVAWIAVLAALTDAALRLLSARLFPWAEARA